MVTKSDLGVTPRKTRFGDSVARGGLTMRVFIVTMLATIVVTLTVTVSANDKARELKLQQAIDLIESKGDLARATPLLEDVAKSADRALAARGLLHLAQAQERFGKGDALATYQRIVSGFGGSDEGAAVAAVATEARTKLAAVGQKSVGLVAKQVWQQTGIGYYANGAAVSPDGRSLAYVDWNTGDIGVHDLASGRDRLLTSDSLRTQTYAEDPVFSPDSSFIAYGLENDADRPYELRVISRSGGQPRVVRRAVNRGDKLYVQAWHPDGKQILATEGPDDNQPRKNLVLLSLDGETTKTIIQGVRGGFEISPDGRFVTFTKRQGIVGDLVSVSLETGQEYVVHRHPADERMLSWHPSGNRLFFLSDRGGSWGVWSVPVANGVASGDAQLVRADTGLIESAGFTQNGDFYYDRHVNQDEVYIAELNGGSASPPRPFTRIEGRFEGFKGAAVWSPTGDRLAYVQTPVNPQAGQRPNQKLVVHSMSNQEARPLEVGMQTFFSPVWHPDGTGLILQGTIDKRIGLFKVDAQTGQVTALAVDDAPTKNPIRIRAATAPGIDKVFFRTNPEAGIFSRDLGTGNEKQVTTENSRGLEVSPDGQWLAITRPAEGRGVDLVVVPSAGGVSKRLATLPDGVTQGFPLAWSADSKFVLVPRQRPGGQEIVSVPLDGKAPTGTGLRWSGRIGRISAHPDGRQIAVSTQRLSGETWVLQNIPARR